MPQPSGDTLSTRPVSCGTSSDTRADLWRRWRADGDVDVRNALIVHHAPLVKWVANRIDLHVGVPADRGDLFGWGMFGLIDAIESFEPELGYQTLRRSAPDFRPVVKRRSGRSPDSVWTVLLLDVLAQHVERSTAH